MSAPSDLTRLAVVVDRQVRSRGVDVGSFTADNLFAVVILWDPETSGQWIGWLTARTHRSMSMCFTALDLADARFDRWLASLPRWNSADLSRALERPGLHLVWRRPAD